MKLQFATYRGIRMVPQRNSRHSRGPMMFAEGDIWGEGPNWTKPTRKQTEECLLSIAEAHGYRQPVLNRTEPYGAFIVFTFDYYYPGGGLNDVFHSCATVEEAREAARMATADVVQILDTTTGEEVE